MSIVAQLVENVSLYQQIHKFRSRPLKCAILCFSDLCCQVAEANPIPSQVCNDGGKR